MKELDRVEFGKRLRRLRKARKLVAKDVAKALGCAESTVLLYESGRRTPDIDTLNKLAQFYDVTTDYLLNASGKKMNDLAQVFKLGDLTYKGMPLSEEELRRVEDFLRFTIQDKLFANER